MTIAELLGRELGLPTVGDEVPESLAQHEHYDDVKAALMSAVMTSLRDRLDLFEKLGEESSREP